MGLKEIRSPTVNYGFSVGWFLLQFTAVPRKHVFHSENRCLVFPPRHLRWSKSLFWNRVPKTVHGNSYPANSYIINAVKINKHAMFVERIALYRYGNSQPTFYNYKKGKKKKYNKTMLCTLGQLLYITYVIRKKV